MNCRLFILGVVLLISGCRESTAEIDARLYRDSLVRVKKAVQQNPPDGKELMESMRERLHRFELAKPNLTPRQVKAGSLTGQSLAAFAEIQRRQAAQPNPVLYTTDAYKEIVRKTADEVEMSIEAFDNNGGFKSLRGGEQQ
jgi:hypothetical protein